MLNNSCSEEKKNSSSLFSISQEKKTLNIIRPVIPQHRDTYSDPLLLYSFRD